MYFSKNSRYVLQKAQVFSSKFWVAGKKLSFKIPQDDPTKPPLRVNIPKDSSEQEDLKKHLHEVSETNAAGLLNPQSDLLSMKFGEDLISGDNLNKDFPSFVSNETKDGGNSEKKLETLEKKTLNEEHNDVEDIKYGKSLSDSNIFNDGLKNLEINNSAVEELSSITKPILYVIVDDQEQISFEPQSEPNSSPLQNQATKAPLHQKGNLGGNRNNQKRKAKTLSDKNGLEFLGTNFGRVQFHKIKRPKKFRVIEIEDASSYTFQGRLSRNDRKESVKSWRVPEKEFRSPLEDEEMNEVPVKVSKSKPAMSPVEKFSYLDETFSKKREDGLSYPVNQELEYSRRQMGKSVDHLLSAKLENEAQILQEVIGAAEEYDTELMPQSVECNHQIENSNQEALLPQNDKSEEVYPYLSIHELKSKKLDKSSEFYQGKEKKKFMASSIHKKPGSQTAESERLDTDAVNFQTAASYVCFGCDKISTNFGAAFPPLLNEALKNRFKFKKGLFSSEKLGKNLMEPERPKPSEASQRKLNELSENSILFPKKENFDCESLFTTREDVILNLIKHSETKKQTVQEQTAKAACDNLTENTTNSIDSLSVMKKVREIVQFDLDNAVKIFKNGKPENPFKDISSVVVLKENGWEVDFEELSKQVQQRGVEDSQMKTDILGDKIPKYLPPSKNPSELKLSSDSVIMFNSQTNEFSINKEALAEAIARKLNEPYIEVKRTLDFFSDGDKTQMKMKRGDSILVFDDETQSWKVDFSILEKREEQVKIEEELTRRSELILETFEKLEKEQTPSVQMPSTRDTKTFDYKKEQWNSYNTETKKSKSPFKESDAEEIRKQNSDLYENLFVANKKETVNSNSSDPNKKAASCLQTKASGEGSGSQTTTPTSDSSKLPPKESPVVPPKESPAVPPKEEKTIIDDNFWDSFLRSNILPRDITEIGKIPPVSKTPPPSKTPPSPHHRPAKPSKPQSKTPTPPSSSTTVPPPTIVPPSPTDKPSTDTPKSTDSTGNIDDTKFKIRIPFIKDKKIKTPDTLPPNEKPTEESEKKTSKPGSTEDQKKPPPKVPPPTKTPPPSSTSKPKMDTTPTKPLNSSPSTKDSPKTEKTPPKPEDKPKPPKEGTNPKTPGKPISAASATEHYVSDKIIEISRNKPMDNKSKILTNKLETVKVNINSGARLPSKVKEINLNKQSNDTSKKLIEKDSTISKESSESNLNDKKESVTDRESFYKNFEKYKTPFSDPEFEEKTEKIRSDVESNPNLKKLDNWNKTLVLHDIVKPPENIENWLKEEADKMATLLLKVLHEAGDGKKKKKTPVKTKGEKQPGKGNPYDSIRKKQENNPDNFLFRIRTVNWTLDNDPKAKQGEKTKMEEVKTSAVRPENVKHKLEEPTVLNLPTLKNEEVTTPPKDARVPASLEEPKGKKAIEEAMEIGLMKESWQVMRMPYEFTEDVPGPEILKKISNAWKVFPILGSQVTVFTLLRLFKLVNIGSSILNNKNIEKVRATEFTKLFTKYGPIVNVQGPLSGNVILIYTPEHLNSIFEQDVSMNTRSVFDSLEIIRRDSDENGTSSIFTDWSKPQWNDLRKATNDVLTTGIEKYLETVKVGADSLINIIRKNRNAQNTITDDFMEDIKRWSLEGLCNVLFDNSMGLLEGKKMAWVMEPNKMHMALDDANNALNKCERRFQLWRLMSTPSSMALSTAYKSLTSILSKQIYQSEMNLRSKEEFIKNGTPSVSKDLSFIESMMLNDGMTIDEITCNLVDVILIGTNMMNSIMGFLLYHLSRNVKAQKKLFNEVKEMLPTKDDQLSYQNLSSMKYLQACFKECLRLNFPIPVFYRLLQNDVILANYIIPKSTYVVMDFRVFGMKDQVFDEPDKFMPSRWLSDDKWMENIHPFTAFPFCQGPRAELAKRIAEMQLLTCIAKIVRNFQIEYHYGEINSTDSVVSLPDKPLKFTFTEREE